MGKSTKYFDLPLKSRQEKGVSALREFINGQWTKAFLLNGYAGTGKTTLTMTV